MANIIWAESGTDATQDTKAWTISGTVISATDQARTGLRSIKLSSTGSVAAKIFNSGILADSGRRISFGYRLSALPSANIKTIFDIETSGFGTCFGVTINSAGTISIYNNAFSIVATGSTVLSANTWYRITIVYTITSSSVNSVTVYLNGISEVTASNLTMTTGSNVFLMQITESVGTQNAWGDDFFIDNGTSGDTGDIHIVNKRPFSNGTTNGFTTQIGSGGSGYGSGHAPQVNEQPLSITNGWSMIGAGSAVTEEYSIEGASAGDVDISGATIIGVNGWVYASSVTNETASIIVLGGTGSISLTSTKTFFTGPVTTSTYPGGGTDIGIITSTTLTTVSLYECGLLIAYIPSITTAIKLLSLLGVG